MNGATPNDLTAMQRMAMMRHAEAVLKRDPRNVDALVTMASLVAADRSAVQALDYLKRALAVKKSHPELLRRTVACCLDAKLYQDARKFCRKLCEVEPRNGENWRSYGYVQEQVGNPAAAIEAYEKALKLLPQMPSILHDIGRCHGLAGDHAKALAFYEECVRRDPTYGIALYSLAASRKFTSADAEQFVAKLDSAIANEKDPVMLANLEFAAGKVFDDVKKPDDAFPRFKAANAKRTPEKPQSFHFARNLIAAFDKPMLERKFRVVAQKPAQTQMPIFVFGMPRSGTTLTESLCGAHSKVSAGDEQTFMSYYLKHLGRDHADKAAFVANIAKLTPADLDDLAQDYLKRCGHLAQGKPHFTDKLPHNFQSVGLIHILYPSAGMIHVRRHPLDNCLSLFSNSMQPFHNDYKTDLTQLGLYYRQYLQLMDHWRSVLPGRMHEVFYEDLVANTELNARAMIAYLGLDWEDGVMQRTDSQRSVRTLSGWQVRQPVYSSSKGKWRQYEKHLGPLIDALGEHVEAYENELAALSKGGPV